MARSLRGPCFFAFWRAWGRGVRIATGVVRPRNDRGFCMGAGCGGAGRCGERIERRRWRMKRDERVAAVKILSVRRKAAQKFWAPQQDHRPLRKCNKRCNGRATARVTAPTEGLQEVRGLLGGRTGASAPTDYMEVRASGASGTPPPTGGLQEVQRRRAAG